MPDNATNKEIKWSSSDESKATIVPKDPKGETAQLTTKSTGYVILTATSVDNPNVKLNCYLNILPKPSSITINKTTTSIVKGSTEKLIATVKPDGAPQDVNWHSDNEAVATVDDHGIVRAVSAGKVEIVAYTHVTRDDGEDIIRPVTCVVTVTEPDAHVAA